MICSLLSSASRSNGRKILEAEAATDASILERRVEEDEVGDEEELDEDEDEDGEAEGEEIRWASTIGLG